MDTTTEEVVERQFTVGPRAAFELENVSGSIVIRRGADGIIDVRAEKHGGAHHVEIDLEQMGDRVIARTRHNSGPFGLNLIGGGMHGSVRYDVHVPRGCDLRVKGVNASIDVADVGGRVNLNTVSGRIAIDEAAGEAELSTVSGSIHANRVSGTAMVKSTSGGIEIRTSRLETYNVSTVSGSVVIESPLVSGRNYVVRTVSGSVQVAVPLDTAATVSLKSVSGSARFDLPAQVIKAGRRSWQGVLNGGGANLEVHSVSGSLRVTPGETGPEPDRLPRFEPEEVVRQGPASIAGEDRFEHDDQARLEILRRLQQGEISIEQATEQLGTLDEASGRVVEL